MDPGAGEIYDTEAAARAAYDAAGETARSVLLEAAKAMDFDEAEYANRVTPEVVETVRDVVFARRLRVDTGSRAEFDDWRASAALDVTTIGSEQVDNVAWHAVPFAGTAVAATFQNESDAAVETLRRQAVGRIYREQFG